MSQLSRTLCLRNHRHLIGLFLSRTWHLEQHNSSRSRIHSLTPGLDFSQTLREFHLTRSNPVRWVWLSSSFTRWGNGGCRRPSDLPKAAQLAGKCCGNHPFQRPLPSPLHSTDSLCCTNAAILETEPPGHAVTYPISQWQGRNMNSNLSEAHPRSLTASAVLIKEPDVAQVLDLGLVVSSGLYEVSTVQLLCSHGCQPTPLPTAPDSSWNARRPTKGSTLHALGTYTQR